MAGVVDHPFAGKIVEKEVLMLLRAQRPDGGWGEKPFDRRCDGLTWDGEQLWGLDNRQKRICVIEKAVRPSSLTSAEARVGGPVMDQRAWPQPSLETGRV